MSKLMLNKDQLFKVKCIHFVSFNFRLQMGMLKKINIILRKLLQKDPFLEENYITKSDIFENLDLRTSD